MSTHAARAGQGNAFAGVLVEYRQYLDRLAVSCPIEKKVHDSDVIPTAAAIGPRFFLAPNPLSAPLLRHLQACCLPQPLHALAIHRATLALEHDCDAAIAKTRKALGKTLDVSNRSCLIGRHTPLVMPGRSCQPDSEARCGKRTPSLEQGLDRSALLRRAHHFFRFRKRRSSTSTTSSASFFFSLLFSVRSPFSSLA